MWMELFRPETLRVAFFAEIRQDRISLPLTVG